MEIVRESNFNIIEFMGGAQLKRSEKHYRLNKFIVEARPNKDIVLMYNALTGGIISLTNFERSDIFTDKDRFYRNFMIETYYLVPDNFNEDAIIDDYRKSHYIPINENYLNKIKGFTILTTTKCNARCPYCYQHSIKGKQHMTLETAEQVSDYIINSTFKGDQIMLDWFGGEPLFNKEVIDLITCRVGNSGRDYYSSMISNAYLFDDETIEHAINYWKLKNIQITLDGTEKVYNKTKNYIYKDDPSPFNTIIRNLHSILEHNMSVALRLNVDLKNADNVLELTNYLVKEFSDYSTGRGLTIYCWPLFELGFTRTTEERAKLCSKLSEINNIIYRNRFGHFAEDSFGIKWTHCMVDSGTNVVIGPSGNLGLCEHHIDNMLIGHISNPLDINMDMVYTWRNYIPYKEICKDCPMKPTCLKENNCPSYKICEDSEKEYTLNHARLGIIEEYMKYIDNIKNNTNNSCSCNDK